MSEGKSTAVKSSVIKSTAMKPSIVKPPTMEPAVDGERAASKTPGMSKAGMTKAGMTEAARVAKPAVSHAAAATTNVATATVATTAMHGRRRRTGCDGRRSGQRDHHFAQHDVFSICCEEHQRRRGSASGLISACRRAGAESEEHGDEECRSDHDGQSNPNTQMTNKIFSDK